jgi:hypothetical protein
MVQLMAAMVELLQRNAAAQPQPPAPVYRPKELLRTSAGEPRGLHRRGGVLLPAGGCVQPNPQTSSVSSPPPASRRRRQAEQILPR